MTVWTLYLLFLAGIVLSLLLPVMLRWLRDVQQKASKGTAAIWPKLWTFVKPYVKIAVASAVVGFALVLLFLALNGDPKSITWYNAIVYGFGWDSAVQKLLAQ